MLYESSTGNLAGFITAYEAKKHALAYRTKISQVYICPNFQKKGLGSKMYEVTYSHYLAEDECYQVIVEDSNDNFQVIQDTINSKKLLEYHPRLTKVLKQHNRLLHTPEAVL